MNRRTARLKDLVEASYRRSEGFEKRRLLAEEWARYCGEVEPGPAEADSGAKVVPLRKSARVI